MLKQQKNEEQIKKEIINKFSSLLEESASDRRQVLVGQLWKSLNSWCTNYFGINTEEIGLEIFSVIQRLIKNYSKIPKEENEFFMYLKTAIKMAYNEYIRKNTSDQVKIPRDARKRIRIVRDIITAKENYAGRKLTANEQRQCILAGFSKTGMSDNEIIAEYLKFTHMDNINNIDSVLQDTKSTNTDPQDEFFLKLDILEKKEILEQVLQNMQNRTRECYRSLFTAYCIDKSIVIGDLSPLLDNDLLETYKKEGEIPKQYEIYLKYHPEVKKDSAGVRASGMITDFLKKLHNAANKKL